ncbi:MULTISPECIES: I78 family peptidase inhibitor [Streptomyces]|nr:MULTISPECIES: I78 family peptidase inhibitor [Streptomyces]NNG86999.1 hypothetical protein [Streptomyces cacaoi]QHF94207.1 hypothetical protein DEH18_10510 [Streptomyces sp. NHF165]
MAPESPEGQSEQDEPARYVGLAADDAEQRAREQGWHTVRRLAPDAVITMEYVAGRLNLAVDAGEVVRCWKG